MSGIALFRVSIALAFPAALLVVPARLDAADRMTLGQWEFTMTTKGESHVSKYFVDADLAAVVNGDSRTRRLGACPK